MEKCKYPNEACANMKFFRGNTYCDSVPCVLKEELPKPSNADKIRAMSDEELAELFTKLAWNSEVQTTPLKYLDWLQSEAE